MTKEDKTPPVANEGGFAKMTEAEHAAAVLRSPEFYGRAAVLEAERRLRPMLFARAEEPGVALTETEMWQRIDKAEAFVAEAQKLARQRDSGDLLAFVEESLEGLDGR